MDLFKYLSRHFQIEAAEITPLPSSFNMAIHKIKLTDNSTISAPYLVIKSDLTNSSPAWKIEAEMLTTLQKAGWPVPKIFAANKQCFLMEWMDNDNSSLSNSSEYQLGATLAKLHKNTSSPSSEAPFFGYKNETPIGALIQPNTPLPSWIDFFRERRLLHFATIAHQHKQLPASLLKRLHSLAENLETYLTEPPKPALIHGDIWSGNVMVNNAELTGFIDPAIYFAHPEIELSFIKMFHTFSNAFYEGYHTVSPLENEFHTIRAPIYNLYPTLVHLILFGQSYLPPIEHTLNSLNH